MQLYALHPEARTMPAPKRRPQFAYKLLVILLYGQFPSVLDILNAPTFTRVRIIRIRQLARYLGTYSKRVNEALNRLEGLGYISRLSWNEKRTEATFHMQRPPNIQPVARN